MQRSCCTVFPSDAEPPKGPLLLYRRGIGRAWNRSLMLVRSWMERIACANSGAIETTEMFGGNGYIRYSIVSVTNICLIALAPIFVAAPRDSTACVTAA